MGIFDEFLAALGVKKKEPKHIPSLKKQEPAPVNPTPAPSVQTAEQSVSPAPKPAAAAAKRPMWVDADIVRPDEIYTPVVASRPHPQVERITLSEAEAIALGWRFRKKSRRRARIVKYLGAKKDLIIPAQIGEWTVNEIRAGAFYRSDIYSVQIPDTVKKIGKNCFRQSGLRSVVIAGMLAEIPENFAFSCQHLTEVVLPYSVVEIGNSAFSRCSALSFLQLPAYIRRVEAYAFLGSGLTRFAMSQWTTCRADIDGSAFLETPLAKKYRLIARENTPEWLDILLVCPDKRTLRLPHSHVRFGRNAIANVWSYTNVLYCGQCKSVLFDSGAVSYSQSVFNGVLTRKNDLTVVVPKSFSGAPFADCVNVCYPDGQKYNYIKDCQQDDGRYSMPLLPSGLFQRGELNIAFARRSKPTVFQPDAISTPALQSVSLGWMEGEGNLFHSCCGCLHDVEWECPTDEPGVFRTLRVFLPSASAIGNYQHQYLLNAFCGRHQIRDGKQVYTFFDSSYFTRIFKKQDSKEKHMTQDDYMHMVNHEHKKYRKYQSIPPRMRQKHRIMLALDVMRSADALFPDKEMYDRFLQAHRSYALTLTKELPAEYRKLLEAYYANHQPNA